MISVSRRMSASGDPLDALPSAVLADVLGRVADAGDIAACRLASRALFSASYQCPRVRLCAADRARSRLEGRGGGGGGSPSFRATVGNLASLLGSHLWSLALDAADGQGSPDDAMWVEEGEFDEADDLHLTSGEAVAAWAATSAGPVLREVEIADFWPQACWRKAEALPLISHFCPSLVKLGLRKAWLSVDGLEKMPNLTHLTLEFIRLDDENLDKLNECFPCLHTLNLIGVGGLKDPKVHLPQLKTCRWEVSNIPGSLAVHAPNLVFLDLKCVRPDRLILDTPSLSTMKLTIDKLGATVQVDGLVSLINVHIESLDLSSLFPVFIDNRAISTLELELPDSASQYELLQEVNHPDYLLRTLASISEVKLAPRFSSELIRCLALCRDNQFRSSLKKLLIHIPPSDCTFQLLPLFQICAPFCKVTVLFHADSSDDIRQAAMPIWIESFPEIRWQWGPWK
ncbi:F-box/LRR-repeat protein At4g29420 [Phragmites australis]|uniref:F-box/LRR-repeat protein At4g29420 n=1 Tax=Phragmites australis TaxID=29695 RepID=UPI002D793FAD|nr:F-box/LRR-repeat protein At4g29420 [Phragmites australis]